MRKTGRRASPLPASSRECRPELNPEERLNGDLKQAIGAKVPARTKAKLKSVAIEHMTQLEQDPERAMSYFQDPFVKYATSS